MILRINFIHLFSLFFVVSSLFSGCTNKKTKDNNEKIMIDSIAELYHRGNFKACINIGSIFIKEHPKDSKVYHILSSAYLALEKDSLAEFNANQALTYNPNNAIALLNKAILLDKKEKYKEANFFYEKSIKSNDSLYQTYSNFAGNRILVNDFEKAVKLGKKAIEIGNNVGDKAILCFTYHKLGNKKKRDSLFLELKKLNYKNITNLKALISD